jgi:molybdenum cofactor biosynthesis enzyme MoaA
MGMLLLGFRCSQDCHFCWQARDWPDVDAARYDAWLDDMAAQGVRAVTFTGGEPTLYAALPALVERARSLDMTVHLQTNAIRLGKPDYLARLVSAGVSSLLVSLHAADAELSDRMTRAPGTHVRTLQGIRAALAAGLYVALNCVVERANVQALAAHARFVVDELVAPFSGAGVRLVNYSQPGPYFDRPQFLHAIAPLGEVRPQLSAAVRTLHAAGVEVATTTTSGFPRCVLEPDVAVGWQLREAQETQDLSSRAFASVCQACAAKPYCVGPRRESLERDGERGLLPFVALPESFRLSTARG